jgi:mevalonate kinase
VKSNTFYSHGKLLLSGEYVVLDGALSLAVPTKFGQSLSIEPINESKLVWISFDVNNKVWYKNEFDRTHFLSKNKDAVSKRLSQILNAVKTLNAEFLESHQGFKVKTNLEFPINWGLGTSSTLINNISQWANIDAYKLLSKTFGGSGYDIACAQNNNAITYQLQLDTIADQDQKGKRLVNTINFNPTFKEHIYFVHLNKKQNSRDGIKHYHNHKANTKEAITKINTITLEMTNSKTLEHFQSLMVKHEAIISRLTNQKPIKEIMFQDFNGAIKSLGAWGGDFIMVASKTNPERYFKEKGFFTTLPYSKMVI